MKSIIPWVLAVALAAAAWLFYATGAAKDQELKELRSQAGALDQLRRENETLKKQTLSTEEVSRLLKDNEELPRLRNEVRQLRAQARELTNQLQTVQRTQARAQQQLTDENAALRTQAQQLQTANAQATQAKVQVDGFAVACINNLRQMDAAKQQWALEHNKPVGTIPNLPELQPYLPQGIPVCPAGGTYTWNTVGTPPTCTIPGHTLVQK